ncbi:MAG: helix-turn-helix transcriptional regulator [Deltaproteobacteria bacterium]|nr:helix-turn-helix transcriptional regulator [Deltaproteobacteria bacterium]
MGDIDPATKKGRKRAAILDVATRLFGEKGYRDTSMDEIAAEVGVAKGTLYLYFPQKLDLLFAATARQKLEWFPLVIYPLQGPGRPTSGSSATSSRSCCCRRSRR